MTNKLKALILREASQTQPPSRVIDIDRAVREGSGIHRRTLIATLAAGGAVLSVAGGTMIVRDAPGPAGPGSEGVDSTDRVRSGVCTVRELPVPEGVTDSRVTAGDPSGRYLVGSAWGDRASEGLLVLWENGQPTTFSVPGAARANVTSVNALGVAVGSSDVGPWRYADGKVTLLPSSAGQSSFATSINSPGDVVGYRTDGPGKERAIIWPAHEPGVVRDLADRSPERNNPYENTMAAGIGDDGTIVGFADLGSTGSSVEDRFQVVVWREDGQLHELTRRGRGPAGHVSIRSNIILESSQRDESSPILWRWLSNAYVHEELPVQMDARSFNRNMVVVGNRPHADNQTSAVILRETRVLAELALPNEVHASAAVAVSDNGDVFGNVKFESGREAAVWWSGC